MKISVSNIAWDHKNFYYYLDLLKKLGCSGVEIAPSCIWKEPIHSSKSERQDILKSVNERGLEIVGFHSLLYTRPDLQLFKSPETRKSTVNYIKDILNLCSDLSGKQVVFGSPNNRKLNGRCYNECIKQAEEDFYKIAEVGKACNVYFCIEPLGSDETEFIKSIKEGGDLVKKINHPFFKLHLDSKAIFSTKEKPENIVKNYKNLIQHVHVGDQNLLEPGTKNFNHYEIGAALRKINYSKYISIEMRKSKTNAEETIKRSIIFVKKNYLGIECE